MQTDATQTVEIPTHPPLSTITPANAPLPNPTIGPFVLNENMEYAQDVKVTIPTLTPGQSVTQKFVVVFLHKSPEERGELSREHARAFTRAIELMQAESEGRKLTDDERALVRDTPAVDLAMLREVVVRIESGVVDSKGRDISREPGTRDLLLRNSWARRAMWDAFVASLRARDTLGN